LIILASQKSANFKEVVINFESVLPFFSNKAHTSSTIGEISVNEEDTLLTIGKMTFDGKQLQDQHPHLLTNPKSLFEHQI
jgi:SET domain-containing protein